MEGRNFHTTLMGGFRKKDVVAYLAEEKRLQEAQTQELLRLQEELEQQLEEIRTQAEELRLQNEDLQAQLAAVSQQLELAQQETAAVREAQARTEAQLNLAEAEKAGLQADLDGLREQVENRPPLVDESELSALREALQAERQRVSSLESQLRQRSLRREDPESADQLWALCGKMERTIRQMEQMLDGPYHMTCYPGEPYCKSPVEEPLPEEPEELPEEPVGRTVRAKPSVSSLLQRVRGK